MTDKAYRFASITRDGDKWRVDVYEAIRPLAGASLTLEQVDLFLARAAVDEVMLDERKAANND